MDDYISRQAAIDAIEHRLAEPAYQHTGEDWYVGMNCAESELYELPSAQTEPCDDPRADVYNLAEKIGIHRLYALVVELRGEPEPCEDAVSREAVSSWLKQYGQDVLHGKYKFSLMYIWKNLMDLPSAQAEIIRCKDCKKREHCRTTNTWAVAPSDDWFCADAERRDDG